MYRYARAVHEGVGRVNLRLLAAVLAGQLAHGAVYADEFYRWADVLAGLTTEEIVVLAGYLRRTPKDLRATRLVELGAEVYKDIYGAETAHRPAAGCVGPRDGKTAWTFLIGSTAARQS